MTQVTPYGSWQSPITAELLTAARPGFDYPSTSNGKLYWLESRPWENGRATIVEKSFGNDTGSQIRDVLPAPLSVRSRVHEYGGTPYIVIGDILYFCLNDDQRIYRLDINSRNTFPEPVTPDNGYRYADFCYDSNRQRLICVCETPTEANSEPENFIASIALNGKQQVVKLVSGNDFYAYPRLSPDGHQLCWISWDHPHMPWDNTQLHLADINTDGSLAKACTVAGDNKEQPESIFQPQWSPCGTLHFVSDRNNWWNIYRLNSTGGSQPVYKMDAEFATPLWVLGMSTYGFLENGTIVCCYSQNGKWQLATITSGQLEKIDTPYSAISAIHSSGNASSSNKAWFVGAASNIEPELVSIDLDNKQLQVEQSANALSFDDCLSQPQAISFATGKNGEAFAHSFYYPPCNDVFVASDNEKPPLIVMCHGGPTGSTSTALNLKIQFWTSRGFAVLDVNYRGSTGYGRDYRQQLNGEWGVADIEDVVCGAEHLIVQGLVDPERIAIRGSSAGGYTVLAALTFTDTFKAGACLYGIGDLETLATDTHKFESRYLDQLIGPYPQDREIYQQRSPVHFTDQLNCPVIFFQGLDDKVVPPEQAVTMVKALREKNLPVAYLPFPGEGHGFRKAETICHALEAELYFYSRIFGFEPADSIEPIIIDNLDG